MNPQQLELISTRDTPQSNVSQKIYFLRAGNSGDIKIGITINPRTRKRTLQTGNSEPLHILAVIDGDEHEEDRLHRVYASGRKKGEWFKPSAELLSYIAALQRKAKIESGVDPEALGDELYEVAVDEFNYRNFGCAGIGRGHNGRTIRPGDPGTLTILWLNPKGDPPPPGGRRIPNPQGIKREWKTINSLEELFE